MAINNALTRLLGIEHPILLAAMDLVADARLTTVVSGAGGFGFLGGGYGDAAWLERELDLLRSSRSERPFGVGFITWSLAKRPELLDMTLAARPRAVWFSFGDPAPFVAKVKSAGALIVCQVQSAAMAKDAVQKGADIIVAQGGEAGGHGISQSSLTLVPAVVDAVGSKVPVVLAGGAADGRALAAALMLGAQGIVMGTRFYATQEAAGRDAAKQRILTSDGTDTLRSIVFDISRQNVWPHPYTGRCLSNAHTARWLGREHELMRRADVLAEFATAREAGDFEIAPVIAGEATALIHDAPSATAIVQRTIADAERLLSGASHLVSASNPCAARTGLTIDRSNSQPTRIFMTPEQVALVQNSFKAVAPIASKAADLFYDRLFEIAPNVRSLFPADLAGQKTKLITMLATAVNNLHQLDVILPAVRDLGSRHRGYGVIDAHYAPVGAALLWTLEQGLGPAFTADVKAAWGEAYTVLAGAMRGS